MSDNEGDKLRRALQSLSIKNDLEKRDRKGMTVLHETVESGDVDLVQFLISKGANVHATDQYKRTALHYAADSFKADNPAMFKVLLSAGIDVNSEDNMGGRTALQLLFSRKSIDNKIIELFQRYGAKFFIEDIQKAMFNRDTEAIKALVLCHVIDANKELKGETILHSACFYHNLSIIKFLIKNGANLNALNTKNETPLQSAVNGALGDDGNNNYSPINNSHETYEKIKCIKYLLKKNPDINIITPEGRDILTLPKNINRDVLFFDRLWHPILEYLAIIQLTESLNPSILETISRESTFQNYFEVCIKELQMANNSKVHSDSWISYLNLLTDDKKKLIQYANNNNLIRQVREKKMIKIFPIYGRSIYKRFTKAIVDQMIRSLAAKILCKLLPFNVEIDSTHQSILTILSFLKSKDVQKIIQ